MTVRIALLIAMLLTGIALPAAAAMPPQIVQQLGSDDSDDKIAAIDAIAKLPADQARRVLRSLADDKLAIAGERLLVIDGERLLDAESGDQIKPAPAAYETPTINNRIRNALNGALAALRLFADERGLRLEAARELAANAEPEQAGIIKSALDKEKDAEVSALLSLAYGLATIVSDDAALRRAAVDRLAESSDRSMRAKLAAMLVETEGNFAEPDATVRAAARAALGRIDQRLAVAETAGRIFSGLSLGSILLLAALGLAITYGVMGVINMAHGELLMIGAYATYLVQSLFRAYLPDYQDLYVVAAIPVAFAAAALVGAVMERLIIRHLYGRPLETLLATWGISLMLIQAARVLFGAQNVELSNPSWMSGGIDIAAAVVLPWNRIVIVGFSIGVLLLVWALMNGTRLGMFVRAVTQNRSMAGCVGVPTGRVDTAAFALGAGIAGLGGVALSQIANVGPDMGQGYIVDSFLVVVVGGVGQLAGAVWAALGIGVAAKFLEGWTGAVIAKILLLVFIIVFIQKRPQGLFALKGRFVEN